MFPRWPFQRLVLETRLGLEGTVQLPAGPPGPARAEEALPEVIWHRQGRTARVLLCSARAEAMGIRPGMTLAEAIALAGSGNLRGQAWDPLADRRALEALGYLCQQFSPQVAVDPGQTTAMLWMDVTTTASYFGGEEALCHRVAQTLKSLELAFRLVVADTPSATWAIAHYGWDDQLGRTLPEGTWRIIPPGQTAEVLRPLPVASLRLEPEVVDLLWQLGIYTLDQLARIPPQELRCRFGPRLWRRWQEAIGQLPEVLSFLPPPSCLKASLVSDWPLEERKDLLQALAGLVDQILPPLRARNEGLLALRCLLVEESESPRSTREIPLEVLFHHPTVNKEHILDVLELRLEGVVYRGTIRRVEVTVLQRAPLAGTQGSLEFAGHLSYPDHLSQLSQVVDRLQARLGSAAVCCPVLTGEAQPERSWVATPVAKGLSAGTPSSLSRASRREDVGKALPRPLRLFSQPIPVQCVTICPLGTPAQFVLQGKGYRVTYAWGPERIDTGWWRGQKVRRDYYRAETTTGQRFWLFRQLDSGRWFVHGVFD